MYMYVYICTIIFTTSDQLHSTVIAHQAQQSYQNRHFSSFLIQQKMNYPLLHACFRHTFLLSMTIINEYVNASVKAKQILNIKIISPELLIFRCTTVLLTTVFHMQERLT